jgi:Holliday junction resolvase RusA-like endonuclease
MTTHRPSRPSTLENFVLVVTMKGRPLALPRARFVPGRGGVPVSVTGAAKHYAEALQARARAAVLNAGERRLQQAFAGQAVAVAALWQFQTDLQDTWGKPHMGKPDTDNLGKLVLDCLQKAGALGGDDCRVAHFVGQKLWSNHSAVTLTVALFNEDWWGVFMKEAKQGPKPEWLTP